MFRILWSGALVVAYHIDSASATVVNPSGGDDTAAIQKVCNAGQVVELVAGVYHVSSVNCPYITGKIGDGPYFWYEGQQGRVQIRGTTGPRGAIVCSSAPCAYKEFVVYPAPGSAGFVMDNIHMMTLTNVSVVDDGSGTSGACIDANTQGLNQSLTIQGGVFQHCGGWCVESSNLSDSTFIGAVFSNCQQGGILIQYGFGNRFTSNYIEDEYSKPGLELDGGGATTITGNSFDTNQQDMMFGSGYYASVSGNMSCRNQGNGMFDIEGSGVFLSAAANMACAPAYYVNPTVTGFFGSFQDPNPTYVDQNSQTMLSPFIHP